MPCRQFYFCDLVRDGVEQNLEFNQNVGDN